MSHASSDHPMHLPEREIVERATLDAILAEGLYTTIAMARGDEPYVVTLSYGYDAPSRTLYFHSAHEGLKLEFLAQNPRVCATVIRDKGYVDGQCAHSYASVVMYGTMGLVADAEECRHGMHVLTSQLEADPDAMFAKHELDGENVYRRMSVLALRIDEMTGKEGQ